MMECELCETERMELMDKIEHIYIQNEVLISSCTIDLPVKWIIRFPKKNTLKKSKESLSQHGL